MKRAIISFFSAALALVAPGAFAQVAGPGGHYYQVVLQQSVSWEQARAAAEASTFNGVAGHLATISSAEEDQFIEMLRMEAAPGGYNALWVGGYQEAGATSSKDGWYWVNGEGPIATSAVEYGYSNWQAGEPNDYWGPQSENHLSVGHFNTFGWNDGGNNDGNIHGYVIEYPSGGRAAMVKVSSPDPIAVEHSGPNMPKPSPLDTARFVFTRTGSLSLDLPVYYSIHGTAENGADYNEITRSVIIPAGQAEMQLHIVPRLDVLTVVESMETVGIRIEPSMILTPTAAYDIDPNGREAGAVIYEYAEEQPARAELAVPRNGFSYRLGEIVTFLVAVDHSAQSVTKVEYFAGTTLVGSQTFNEALLGLEFFKFHWTTAPAGTHEVRARVTLSSGAQLVTRASAIQVVAPPSSPPMVGIRFIEPTSTEPVPDADYAPGYVAVVRDAGNTAGDLQVFYSISGTATAGVDYEELQGYVVIPAGKTGAKIFVTAKDDTIDEPNETVILTLIPAPDGPANPTDSAETYTIDPSYKTAQVVILDNDPPVEPGTTVSIKAINTQISEAAVNAAGVFEIVRTGSIAEALDVFLDYTGSAIGGADYRLLPEKVTMPAGAASVFLNVLPFDDQTVEGDETVIATFTPLRGVLYNVDPERKSATMIIKDDDSDTVVRVDAIDPIATEIPPNSDRPEDPGAFRITRTGSLTQNLQVFFSVHGTARNGGDYESIPESITIPAGQASAEIRILPLPDLPTVAHHYEIVAEPNLTWEQARVKAELATYGGVQGHLATITSADEDARIEELRVQNGGLHLWVGGYQEPGETSITEGWKWVNNEGPIPGKNADPGYSNWLPNEPNDYWGAGSENHMVIGWLNSFGWNDQGQNIGAQGYVVEFEMQMGIPEELENVMETVAIRIERSPLLSPEPLYKVDRNSRSAAVVIFDGQAPAGGAIEVAIPSAGEVFNSPMEFLVAAYHPTIDIPEVGFFVDDNQLGTSRGIADDATAGGVTQYHFFWAYPTFGDHILQAKTSVNGASLASSKVPFIVRGSANEPPVAAVTKPAQGEAFIQGEPIEVSVISHDPDGSVAKLEVLLDGTVVKTVTASSVELTILPPPGQHVVSARVTDNYGAVELSPTIQILVRHRDAVAFVHRELPAAYSPGVSFVVELRADPPEGTFAFAIEDRPPSGWRVTEVSDEGAFDSVNGKVKFGPFFDGAPRSMTYRVTPPASAVGAYEFSGAGSVNGGTYPITGDSRIELARQYHPADANQDFRIVLSEVTAYAAAWKAGRSWPTGPVPIPLNYVTRAHHIWQRGEVYRFDAAAGAAPACWVTTSGGAGGFTTASIGSAQRYVFGDMTADAATQVRIGVAPASGSSGYAVEERPPHGWTISNISHEGVFDPATGMIRWGVFADGVARTLSYDATPPPTVTSVGVFAGQLSYDGKLLLVGADARLENSVTISGAAPVRITCEPSPTGLKLNITGPSGQTGVIEASTDFMDWTEVKSIFIPNGAVEFTDETPVAGQRFYRLRVQ